MLVVTRKRHETIRIGSDIVIKVIQLGKGSVKLGIEAPPHVHVLRGELEDRESSLKPVPKSSAKGPLAAFLPSTEAATTHHEMTVDLAAADMDAFLEQFGDVFDAGLESDVAQMHLDVALLVAAN